MAREDSMDDAFFMSAMPLRVLQRDPTIHHDWQELMKRALILTIKEATGKDIGICSFTEHSAPDSELGVTPEGDATCL